MTRWWFAIGSALACWAFALWVRAYHLGGGRPALAVAALCGWVTVGCWVRVFRG